jgi:hypothetical protein
MIITHHKLMASVVIAKVLRAALGIYIYCSKSELATYDLKILKIKKFKNILVSIQSLI